jgi:hypothetical protein
MKMPAKLVKKNGAFRNRLIRIALLCVFYGALVVTITYSLLYIFSLNQIHVKKSCQANETSVNSSSTNHIYLNVGGMIFNISKSLMEKMIGDNNDTVWSTLTRNQSYFDAKGNLFIDRSPKFFQIILDYFEYAHTYREINWPESEKDALKLLAEARHLKLEDMIQKLEQILARFKFYKNEDCYSNYKQEKNKHNIF